MDGTGTHVTKQAWVVDPKRRDGPDWARFRPVTGVACLNKPRDRGHRQIGLWTSTFLGPEHVSGWVQWCLGESFAGPEFRVWLLEPDPVARVLTVDSMDDLKALLATYGAEGEMRRMLGRDSTFPEADFDRLAADGYSGIRLTEQGQWATRLPLDPDAPSLYGWDCESTLWFRWAFTTATDLGVLTATTADDEEGSDGYTG